MKRRPTKGQQDNKMPSQRQLRVGERIRHILSKILQREEFHDPILANANMITVTAVDISPDLKNATAYIIPLGSTASDELLEAMNKVSGFFRTKVSGEIDMRHTPRITFKRDHSFDQAFHIEHLLNQEAVRRDVEKSDDDNNNDTDN